MTHLIAIILLIDSVGSTVVVAQDNAPVPILPDTLHWMSPSNVPGLQTAWVLGAE